jgi:hypothetical protein
VSGLSAAEVTGWERFCCGGVLALVLRGMVLARPAGADGAPSAALAMLAETAPGADKSGMVVVCSGVLPVS